LIHGPEGPCSFLFCDVAAWGAVHVSMLTKAEALRNATAGLLCERQPPILRLTTLWLKKTPGRPFAQRDCPKKLKQAEYTEEERGLHNAKRGPAEAGPLLFFARLGKQAPQEWGRSYSAAISSASPSWRIISSSRSAASISAETSCCTLAAASSSSGESWTLR
jgi:hypothetical protein